MVKPHAVSIVLEEVMFEGVASGGAAAIKLKLAINRGDVGIDGASTDYQFFGDLGISQALGQQAQYLKLACRQFLVEGRHR